MSNQKTKASFFKRFFRANKGATALIFSVMAVPVMALAAGVVDYGKALRVKSELIATLDAAVLAATQAYALDDSVDTEQIIMDFVSKNYTDSGKVLLSSELVVNAPDIDENNELSVQLNVKVPTDFLTLVGFNEFDFALNSSAIVGGMDLEIALVLDNTGSMSGSKIADLKVAATDLVNTLMTDGNDKVQIAVVPFSSAVNISIGNRFEAGLDIPGDYLKSGTSYEWYGCMASRIDDLAVKDEDYATGVPGIMMPDDWCTSAHAPIRELSKKKGEIITSLDNMKSQGWTYIPSGLSWGWRVLSDKAPFTTGVPYSETGVQKAIVLMTDGANTVAAHDTPPTTADNDAYTLTGDSTANHGGPVHFHTRKLGGASNVPANAITAELCANIKAEGIVVHTIAFEVAEGSEIEDLMRNCAGNGGQYFDADNSDELANAFKQIALALLNLRLSK